MAHGRPDNAHGHHHHHGHDHAHAPADFGRAFTIGIALNIAFVVTEAAFGIAANSMALLADAGHNLSDVLGLMIAWSAAVLAKRAPSTRFTFGMRGASILSALFNALVLLVAVGAIAWESTQRLLNPEPIAGTTVIAIAAIGIAINGFTASLFASGRKGDLNIRGAYLHMAADAVISAGVVVAGLLAILTGWLWIDPVASLAIVAAIVWGTWSLLRDSLAMTLGGVPAGIDAKAVRALIAARPGVADLHDLHIWATSTTQTALSVHLVMPGGHPGDAFLASLADELKAHHAIGHATVQIETDANACPLARGCAA
ncbi:MAG: cation diffusion facilitator family transporter [Alphaproteobacteria bacterium]|nr:cation diffusion facilitator family transporter [Alphaproteobacteria bacterium]